MTTLGPFSPTGLSNHAYGGNAWAINGGSASASFSGEGSTDLLRAMFSPGIDSGHTVQQVRFVVDSIPGDFNRSQANVIVGGSEVSEDDNQPSQNGDEFTVEPGGGVTLSPSELNSGFGFQLALYSSNGGSVSLDSIQVFVDVD